MQSFYWKQEPQIKSVLMKSLSCLVSYSFNNFPSFITFNCLTDSIRLFWDAIVTLSTGLWPSLASRQPYSFQIVNFSPNVTGPPIASMSFASFYQTEHMLISTEHHPTALGVFDISISNIDYRYIDTFRKYRYRYRYRYGHSWKYRYRYQYR